MNVPWVVCYDGTKGRDAYAIQCRRCGTIQRVALPISVKCYVSLGRAFAAEHAHCKPQEAQEANR